MNRTAHFWLAAAAALAVASFGFPRNASATRIDLANANIWMAWNSCYGTQAAASNLHYACDGTNVENPLKLVFSFELPSTFPTYHFNMSMATIRIRTADGSTLPDYWRLQLPQFSGCQPATFQVGFVNPSLYVVGFAAFGAGIVDADHCASWYDGEPTFLTSHEGVSFAYSPTGDRIKVEGATASANGSSTTNPGVDMPAGAKLAGGAMLFNTDAGLGTCAGCQQEMVIELVSIDLTSWGSNPAYHLTGSSGDGTVVSWQGSTNGPTAVRNRTWGAVKSLYR